MIEIRNLAARRHTGLARGLATLILSLWALGWSPKATAMTERERQARYGACTGDMPDALKENEAIRVLMVAAIQSPPSPRIDGGRTLDKPVYDASQRANYHYTDADKDAVDWVLRNDDAQGSRYRSFVKLLFLKQVEAMTNMYSGACISARADASLVDPLNRLTDMARRFQRRVYENPGRAELLVRLQSSRGKLFALMRAAQKGDPAARTELDRLAALVSKDALTPQAVELLDASESVRNLAYRKMQSGSTEATLAYATLRTETHSIEDDSRAFGEVNKQRSLGAIQDGVAFWNVFKMGNDAAGVADDRDRAATDYCQNEWPRQSNTLEDCKAKWMDRHPYEQSLPPPEPPKRMLQANPPPKPAATAVASSQGDAQLDAAVDAGFLRWSQEWMSDRYVPKSARADQQQCGPQGCAAQGRFKVLRFGTPLEIPFLTRFSKNGDGSDTLSELCYVDASSASKDCIN